jgi:WD40 repeat protein
MCASRLALLAVLALLWVRPAPAGSPEACTDAYGDLLPAGARYRLGTVRMWHEGGVAGLAWSPDGKTLASAGRNGSVRLWQVPGGAELRNLPGRGGADRLSPGLVAFSPDGRLLATAGGEYVPLWNPVTGKRASDPTGPEDGVQLWDAATGKRVRRLGAPDVLSHSIAFAPDGKTLAAGGCGRFVRLFAVDTGREVRRFESGTEHALVVAFSTDGKALVADDCAGNFFCWETASGKRVETPVHSGGPGSCLAFAPDGTALAVTAPGRGNPLRLYRWPGGEELRRFAPRGYGFASMTFAPDGKTLAAADLNHGIRLWEVATGRELRPRLDPGSWYLSKVASLVFSPDGMLLASGGRDGVITLWDVHPTRGLPPCASAGHRQAACALVLGGRAVATSAWDRSLVLYDTRSGRELRRLEPWDRPAFHLKASADGTTLAAWDSGRALTRWDVPSGRRHPLTRELPTQTEDVALSPNGRTLALADAEGAVRLWDAATGKELRRLSRPAPDDGPGERSGGTSLWWTGDEWGLAVAPGLTGTIVQYDLDGGTRTIRLERPRAEGFRTARVFSPDGRLLFEAEQPGTISVLEVASGLRVRHFPSGCDQVFALALAGDGRTLACGGGWLSTSAERGESCLVDLATGKLVQALPGRRGIVHTLFFSPDDTLLFSASTDATVLGWDVAAATGRPRPTAADLPDARLAALWADLAAGDAARGQQAVRTLTDSPGPALRLLGKALTPAASVPVERLASLIAELDHEEFARRERAEGELKKLGEVAVPALSRALEARPSPEARRRLSRLLEVLGSDTPPPNWLRQVRALQVLEGIASAEARRVLEGLARGAADSPLTREARAVLRRLERRAVK